ncbi:MAG TPA: hypothetical protein VF844_16350 [Ktedonobacteraceae bacterium]
MNQYKPFITSFEGEVIVEPVVPEIENLEQMGYTIEEIVSLVWLQDWCQSGGSDRVEVVRHLEFLKLLFMNGKMAL